MTRKRFEQLPDDRRARILAVAALAFAKNGFTGTSYNALLSEAGLGKGAAYYYFADKQDLFLTVVKECYKRFFAGLDDLPTPTTVEVYWSQIEEIARRGMLFMRQDPTSAALMQCFVRERQTLDVLSSAELSTSLRGYYTELLRVGQRLGAVRRDLPFDLLLEVSHAVSAAFDQWFVAHGLDVTPRKMTRLSRGFADLARGMLEPRKPPATARPAHRKPRPSS